MLNFWPLFSTSLWNHAQFYCLHVMVRCPKFLAWELNTFFLGGFMLECSIFLALLCEYFLSQFHNMFGGDFCDFPPMVF